MSANLFDNFNPDAQGVLTLSYQILMESRHNQLDVDHILMALLEQRNGVLPQVLEISSIELNPIRRAAQDKLDAISKMISANLETGSNVSVYITPNLQRLFREVETEWQQQGADAIGPEHILLAIYNIGDQPAAQLLKRFGLDRPNVQAALPQVDFTLPPPGFRSLFPRQNEKD